jgi:hypothetical protein
MATLGLLVLVVALLGPRPSAAVPVSVRFAEGATRGFLTLRNVDGDRLASGELLQISRGNEVESRMVFRFTDGSVFDETVVFTQERVFTVQHYRLVRRGPAFPADTEITLARASRTYRVTTTARSDGQPEMWEGTLDLPPDVYNGMVLTVLKNLPPKANATVHLVAFTPTPRLIPLELAPAGEEPVRIGDHTAPATRYVLRPKLGIWLTLLATLLGRVPPDAHAWILTDDVPAFVQFAGPLFPTGPVWLVTLASPRGPASPGRAARPTGLARAGPTRESH